MTQHPAADRDRCTVTVCRGCCCGDSEQHPGVDHAGLVRDLRERVAGTARIRVVDCLLKCDEANVVVVSPTPDRRRSGVGPVWLARVFETEVNELIADWVDGGGPGTVPVPARLQSRVTAPFARPERDRRGSA